MRPRAGDGKTWLEAKKACSASQACGVNARLSSSANRSSAILRFTSRQGLAVRYRAETSQSNRPDSTTSA